MKLNEQDLINKGFIRQPDGSFAKRSLPVGEMEKPIRESNPAQALDSGSPIRQSSEKSMGIRVALVGLRRRALDDDNFSAGCKALRDAIAASLGTDDANIEWEYSQSHTHGPEGVIVLISTKN